MDLNRDIETKSREIAKSENLLYWQDEYMSPTARGSKVRVKPHENMLTSTGHIVGVKINGKEQWVLFDRLYVDYYVMRTGLSPFKPLPPEVKEAVDVKQVIADFLESATITLDPKKPRHDLFFKFTKFVEERYERP